MEGKVKEDIEQIGLINYEECTKNREIKNHFLWCSHKGSKRNMEKNKKI